MTGRPAPEVRDTLDSITTGLDTWLDAHRKLFLSFVSILSVIVFSGYATVRPLFTDECMSLVVFRAPTLGDLWSALLAGVRGDPAPFYWIVRLLFRAFGEHIFLARFPSVLCFTILCLVMSLLVWRHTNALFGAAAFFLPYATMVRGWAVLALPYAAMMAFAALAILYWDRMSSPGRNLAVWRIAFIASWACTVSTHFYSVVLFAPFALGEAAKWAIRKKPDWPAIGCILSGFIPLLCWSPIIIGWTHRYMGNLKHSLDFQRLYNFYATLTFSLPFGIFLILLLIAFAVRPNLRPAISQWTTMAESSRLLLVFSIGSLLIPFMGYLNGMLVTHTFDAHYHMTAAFGVIIGLPLILYTCMASRELVGLCLLLAMAGNGAIVSFRGFTGFVRSENLYPPLADLRRFIPDPHPDIVVSSPLHFLPFYETTKDDPENNLLYLYDVGKEVAAYGTDSADVIAPQVAVRSQARLLPFNPYVAAHPHFYMVTIGEVLGVQEWQFSYLLKRMHARLGWLARVGPFDLYQVDIP